MEQAERRCPVLRTGLQFRPLAADRVFIYHPDAASQILDARAGAALQLCHGQLVSEAMPEVRAALEYDCTEEEWLGFLEQLADVGYFEGRPKRHPRVRLFDPAPAIEFLTHRCRWLFSAPTVVVLFLLLLAGLWRLLGNWSLFVTQVQRATGLHPILSVVLYYFCFLPVGLLHELAHGVVCRWFGGEVVEVGLRKDSANLYVLSNTAPLETSRQRILYLAGGAFLDMFIFFLLVNVWLVWPNYVTLMFLLPQAFFVLQFSYAMEGGSDLARIISVWTGMRQAPGRVAFLKEFFSARPKTRTEWERAAIYLVSIVSQAVVAAVLVWSFRAPVTVSLWQGFDLNVPFLPVVLYAIYRVLRYSLMNYRQLLRFSVKRPSPSGS